MLSDSMCGALNEQINAEMYSAYLYQSMAAWASDQGLKGLANWMSIQAKEEMLHAMKIYEFIEERGGRVTLTAIEGPPTEWDSALAVAENVVEHEGKVTSLINALVDRAIEEKDHATRSFLNWFVDEQVEEEDSANDLVLKFKMAANSPGGLMMIDRELGSRVFNPPPTEGE
jgi:ferritin